MRAQLPFCADSEYLDPYEHLLVTTIRLAIWDAQQGDEKAAEWLDSVCSTWRERMGGQRLDGYYTPPKLWSLPLTAEQ